MLLAIYLKKIGFNDLDFKLEDIYLYHVVL